MAETEGGQRPAINEKPTSTTYISSIVINNDINNNLFTTIITTLCA